MIPKKNPIEASVITQIQTARPADLSVRQAPIRVNSANPKPQYWLMMNEQTAEESPEINKIGVKAEARVFFVWSDSDTFSPFKNNALDLSLF